MCYNNMKSIISNNFLFTHIQMWQLLSYNEVDQIIITLSNLFTSI